MYVRTTVHYSCIVSCMYICANWDMKKFLFQVVFCNLWQIFDSYMTGYIFPELLFKEKVNFVFVFVLSRSFICSVVFYIDMFLVKNAFLILCSYYFSPPSNPFIFYDASKIFSLFSNSIQVVKIKITVCILFIQIGLYATSVFVFSFVNFRFYNENVTDSKKKSHLDKFNDFCLCWCWKI